MIEAVLFGSTNTNYANIMNGRARDKDLEVSSRVSDKTGNKIRRE